MNEIHYCSENCVGNCGGLGRDVTEISIPNDPRKYLEKFKGGRVGKYLIG